ncbi:bifunctional acetate--CoA ligase family protein/GNAT family N-acetyltransferase [Baekduia sp. Peel2402]|uniref:bifunctional acetate--CoA ligase family protein/GNAT family N-acetyltransferase n=1 Tax=Baekduia sp. Peel2402 TaxID=3458296 RepID=UPI00403E60FF
MPPHDAPIVRDVILRDGSALRLRSPRPEDEAAIRAFFDGLSFESRYLRFHGAGRSDLISRDYANADLDARVPLVAHLGNRVVAVAGYDRLNEPDAAEVAFAVAEDQQGRGLATSMLQQLADVAAARGITRFDAEVMGENRPMLHVFGNAGFGVRRASTGGIVHLALDLTPTDTLATRIDDRTHAATVLSLRALLAPRSVAVVGASAREGSVGGAIFRGIVEGGYRGVATPIHPDRGVVGSTRAVASLSELDEPAELAVVAVAAGEVLGVAREAAAAGVRALLVVSTGFGDTDEPEGRAREEELLAEVRAHGLRLVGPNALGVVTTDPDIRLQALIGRVPLRSGGLGLSSQSGALGLALLGHAAARRMGVSSFLALGNRADVSTNDVLEHFADDDRTTVVAFYVESFGNPRRFSQVARRVSRRKPILAVKGTQPRDGSAAPGRLRIATALTDAALTEALFSQAGVLRVESTQTLFDAAELLERQPLPAGRALGIVTNSGGLGTVAADAAAARGLSLARVSDATRARLAAALPDADRLGNPIDLGVRAGSADERLAVEALLDDDGVDAVLVVHVGLGGDDPETRLGALEAAITERETTTTKPVVACVVGGDGSLPERETRKIPNYRFPEAAVRALAIAADRRAWLGRRLGQEPELERFDAGAAQAVVSAAGEGWLGGDETVALLGAAGLELASAEPSLNEADTVAVLVGAVNDPEFGPVVGVAPGGGLGWAGPIPGDAVFRLAPLTDVDAEELVDGPPALRSALHHGPHDAAALRDVVLRLAALADAVPELAEAELDPVLVSEAGVVVGGARVRLAPPPARDRAKTW